MAKMYAKIKGGSLSSGLNKSGTGFDRRKNIQIDLDVDRISNLVYRRVMQALKGYGVFSKKPNDTSPQDPSDELAKEHGKWKLSTVGFTMLTSQLANSAISLSETYASGDNSQIAMQTYTNFKGTGTLLLSTFGGAPGMIASVLLNRIDGFVGQYIKNQIQLQYDNARLDYNLTRMDIGRNSTYTYDTEQQKWTARDVQRVRNNILNQTTSS